MDELNKIESNNNSSNQIDFYRQRKAKNVSISVVLYILSVVALIAITCIPTYFGKGTEDSNGVIGVIVMLLIIAIATGIMIYTNMSTPSEIKAQILSDSEKSKNMFYAKTHNKKAAAITKAVWPFVLVIYLGVSFWTGAWHITWIIWLIAVAVKNAVYAFTNIDEEEKNHGNQ